MRSLEVSTSHLGSPGLADTLADKEEIIRKSTLIRFKQLDTPYLLAKKQTNKLIAHFFLLFASLVRVNSNRLITKPPFSSKTQEHLNIIGPVGAF